SHHPFVSSGSLSATAADLLRSAELSGRVSVTTGSFFPSLWCAIAGESVASAWNNIGTCN
ncbi:hypothetical protein LINPERHAP1_LOCUS7173, partial [Linum perenne]